MREQHVFLVTVTVTVDLSLTVFLHQVSVKKLSYMIEIFGRINAFNVVTECPERSACRYTNSMAIKWFSVLAERLHFLHPY